VELLYMRVLYAVVPIVLGIAGATAVRAADLPAAAAETYSTRQSAIGHHTGAILVYDFQPGVIARAYWRAPWRHRHYFPVTGRKPEIGRDEDLSATGSAPESAETFQRSWSTSSAFVPEAPRGRVPPLDADQPPQSPAPLK
jgi:hypothetical protein